MSREVSVEKLIKDAHRILENPFWIPEIATDVIYSRIEDDCDGDFSRRLTVEFNRFGDAYVNTSNEKSALRFRMPGMSGGGRSSRIRNALMILALAMKLDNEEKSDPD